MSLRCSKVTPLHSYVYFIYSGKTGLYKIGYSGNPVARFNNLNTGGRCLQLTGYIHGDVAYERKLHKQFDHLRVEGEWFNPGPDLLEFIYSHTTIGLCAYCKEETEHTKSHYLQKKIQDLVQQEIVAALQATADGYGRTNNSKAARWLGCSRSNLIAMRKQYKI